MLATFWILFTASLFLIILSLFMSPDSSTFSGALVGSSDLELFKEKKERGIKIVVKWAMFILGALLLILTLIVRALM